ncbi:MAG: FKBP-type peptidyl-prolyl cis-trans isomerase [Actinomycetota bacterium]|nr:FKBP-type peptidyl-prolyl cis-trans isomerase [Actinomycetota bacterium]
MRLRAVAAAALVVPMLLMAGCGSNATPAASGTSSVSGTSGSAASDSASGSAGTSAGASDSAATGPNIDSSPAPTPGPVVPPATAVASAVPKEQLPTVSGKFGQKPTVTVPKGNPPPSLQRQVLTEGTGAVIKKGEVLVTNYLGQIWGGKVFDNSYDRKASQAFAIGVHKVVPGWDVSLVGLKVGSRVLLSLPPADGYGSTGNTQAGIKGTDTLIFVIDIIKEMEPTVAGQTNVPVKALPKTAPVVKGALGKEPTVTIAKGLAEPKKASVLTIAAGTGPKLASGDQILAQYTALDWTGQPQGSTWPSATADPTSGGGTGPEQVQLSSGSPFAALAGVTVGSRVMLLIPADATKQQPSLAVVVDVVSKVGQFS